MTAGPWTAQNRLGPTSQLHASTIDLSAPASNARPARAIPRSGADAPAASHEHARHRPALAHQAKPTRYAVDSPWARVSKRAVDLAIAIPLFVVFAIVYPVVAIALKLTSPGPVLFRQQRVGRHGHPVTIYKIRSMHVDAEARLKSDPELYQAYLDNGYKIPPDHDPRITTIGHFLRRSSLDELPQAICLLRGDMSAVGPRPVLPDELATLHGHEPHHYLVCKPGLTGLWQVSGRSHVVDEGRAQLDEEYARTWTLRQDLQILVRTVPAVLSAHGAH